ncbi:outer membrane lipoprotein carrier protein LolA [Candidatus Poribacteria bacterium]|nr:outer membrane lipoprotein carrier protein LolA [Candidatus Poribacteria bacterium]
MTRALSPARVVRPAVAVWAFFALLAFSVTSAFAAELTALQVFEHVRSTYAAMEAMSAKFEEETIMDGQHRVAQGLLQFKKPGLLRQEYFGKDEPDILQQVIVLDGKMSWAYTPWLNQVTRKAMSTERAQEILPGGGVNFEKIPDNFALALKQDEVADGKEIYLLEMRPKPDADGTPADELLEVWVRAEGWMPLQFAYSHIPNRMTTVIRLEEVDFEAEPGADAFTFTPPVGVEIITITDRHESDG